MKTISKRFLKASLAILLVVVMLFGSTISGFAAVVDNADTGADVDVADTGATITFTSDDVLFFNIKGESWWETASAGGGNYAYFFNNSTGKNAWSAKAVQYSGDIYYVKIPAGTWAGVILTRNSVTSGPTWNNLWNQTGDLTLQSGKNYISDFGNSSTSATWSTQQPTSAASLSASSTSVNTGEAVTLTPSLTSYTTYNEIKSTTYSISPSTGASVSGNTFTATAAGTYTVTATITYNPRGYNTLTKTVTATKTITVTEPVYYYDVTYNANGGSGGPANATDIEGGTSYTIPTTKPTYSGYEFLYWEAGDGAQYQPGASFTVNSDVTLTAQWAKIHTVTYNANGGSGAPANGSVVNGNNYVIPSTVPTRTNYNFTGWKDGSGTTYAAGATISNVTSDITLTAQWELAGVCSPEMDGLTLNIGATGTLKATTNDFCEYAPNSTFTYSIVDGSNYISLSGNTVTAKAAGTAHVKATCSCGETVTCAVVVNAPTVDADDITSLDVNGTVTLSNSDLTITNAPTSYTVTYSTDSDYFSVTESGIITGIEPGTGAVNISMKYNGTTVATGTFNVTVDTPAYSINPLAVNLIVGQTMTDAFTTTADGNPEVTILADATGVISISGNKATALKAGTATVTASFKYNNSYTSQATATVKVADASIKANPTSVALEFGDGSTSTSKTVTLDPNTEDGNGTGDTITVTSANANVATATLSGTTVTITATGVGSTTVTAKFHDAEVEIPVTVSQYDPYVYLYVTNNQGFDKLCIYSWVEGGSNITALGTNMIYIGKNGDGDKIFAYRFLKTNKPNRFIITKDNSWNWQTADITVSWTTTDHKAFYFQSANSKTSMGDWTSDCMIVRPTVSVADVVVPVSGTETATATVENGGVLYWSMADKTVATVADVTTATATVTGVTPGDTTISARAFVDTANSSIKTLPTNYKTDTACWPFISTEATASVTVGSVDYDITAAASYSDNGTDYADGTTGGTVSITVDGENKGTEAAVAHGKDYTLTATAATNYRFVGWYNGSEQVSTEASYTVNAKAAASYTAKFVRTHKVTVNFTEGIESIRYNNISYNESFDNLTVDAGATITVYATPAPGYKFSNWTVVGATVADNTAVNLTVADIQSSVTLTANAVPTYTASATAQTNKYFGTYGGTVTIDGQSSPVQYELGETVTFEAHNNTNYYFDGWYTDAEFTNKVSADVNYQATMTADGITLYALFVKNFYLTSSADERLATFVYNVADNSYSVTADFVDHFTLTSNDNNDVNASDVNVTGGTHTGCTVAGHYTSYMVTPDTENYDIKAPVTYTLTPDMASGVADGTYTMNIALSDAEKVEISVDGTKVADKAIGSTFSYEIPAPAGQYLSGATTEPAVDFEIVDGNIEFTVPDSNVNIVPQFTNYSYVELSDSTGITATGLKTGYKAGEEVSITLSPNSEETTITEVVADYDGAVITQNGDNWTITIASMPADTTITLTPTVDAKFVMNYGIAAIGNYGTGYTTYGTVSMKIGDTTLAKGGYAGPTDTVAYTATPNANFIFDGWYSNESCEKSQLISRDTTYEVTPTADTTVYALFVPRHYIAEDQAKVDTNKEMTYDPATRSFKYSSSTIAKGAWFRVSNNKTTSAWTDSNSYAVFDSSFNVTFNANAYMVTVGWGTQCYALTSDSAAEYPYEIIVEIHGNSSIDVSCKAQKTGNNVYLSSGRLDLPGSYDAAAFEANIKYTHIEETANPTDTYVANEGENREKYKKLNLPEAQTVSFEVEITGTRAADYEVDSFVVYHINTETYTIVAPTTLGNNKYSGSIYLDGDAYIVPVYFLTEKYAADNDLAQIDIYFDASAIQNKAWGPFVACYAWGSNSTEYLGGWSGQMMIPTADGKSFYTMLTVPKATATNPSSIPNGVTFNNYMQSTVPGSNAGAFGISATQYQCYDYREPITLYESGYDVITFVAKDSSDGYHGDRANGVTANTVTSTTTDIFNKYDFDYLYSRDGVTPMDLNGDTIENPVDLSVGKADYYIINKGDITYDPNGTKYVGDNAYDADWSVDWYIFDSTGKFITNIMSTAMWHDKDGNLDDLYTYLHEALGTNKAGVAGKTVAISYEHENNAGHQVSYDGQWYGNYLADTVTGQVKVGFQTSSDSPFVIDDDETPNVADYGEAYLVDADGNKHQTLDIEMDYGRADITAVTKEGYHFVGWYTQLADGSYKEISKAITDNPYINMNETYYAIFRLIAEGEVVINHSTYINDDPAIPSHGGVAEMAIIVENLETGEKFESTPSTSRSSVSFEGLEDSGPYRISIITTPLMNGQFFAWYTDSTKADGTKTYEEVFTREDTINSTSQVIAEFDYEYNEDSQKIINIYSDVRRVTNKANLVYKYKNRYGAVRTYTVKDITLTDEECLGYAGNEGNKYCPTYLTELTFTKAGSDDEIIYAKAEEVETVTAEMGAQGWDLAGSYNMISTYAPKEEVTEVFNGTVNWIVASNYLTPSSSEVILVADQGEPTYTVNYEMAGQTGSKTGYYDELIMLDAPGTYNGKEFSYWYEDATGEILCYTHYYNYRIVEHKSIRAVYGADTSQEWTPSINSVTYTREFGDNGDYIYTDYLLAYNNVDSKILNDVKTSEGIEYGLLLLRDSAYYISDSDNVTYPDASNADINSFLKKVANNGSSAAFKVGDTTYNCYCYDITAETLTNFNRCDYFRKYDNNKIVGGSHYYREYAFTAVSYIIVNGEVYLSNPKQVNFFDLGNEVPTTNN